MTSHQESNHDIPTVLRFIAISMIVANHFKLFDYGGGGAYFLMAMVGYNIATFKLNKVLTSNSVLPIVIMIVKVSIPCILYTLLLHLYYGPFRWEDILMVANFIPERHPNGFSYWFIEVYIQLQLILLVLLSIKPVRRFLLKDIKVALLLFIVFSCSIFFLSEAIWNADHLYRRVPWLILWLPAFGCGARFTESWLEKGLLVAGFTIMTFLFYGELNYYLIISFLFLALKLPFRLPRIIMTPINYIAAGSLFIYLTHFQIRAVLEKLIDGMPLINTITALLIGAMVFHIYNNFVNKPSLKLFYKWHKRTFSTKQV